MKWSKLDLFSVIQTRAIFLNKANLERQEKFCFYYHGELYLKIIEIDTRKARDRSNDVEL